MPKNVFSGPLGGLWPVLLHSHKYCDILLATLQQKAAFPPQVKGEFDLISALLCLVIRDNSPKTCNVARRLWETFTT